MAVTMSSLLKMLSRRKTHVFSEDERQQVVRCLTIVDVSCLGLSMVLGLGVFVLLAHASREHAGPSVILSFLVAAVASCLGGLCYSELATRFPRGGSAYAYTYATTGELCAFLVAWTVILDYGVGAALAVKSWSSLVDAICNGSLRSSFRFLHPGTSTDLEKREGTTGKNSKILPGLETCFDLVALAPLFLVCAVLSYRTKWSCILNNVLVISSLLSLTGVVLVGIINLDAQNWLAGSGFFQNGIAGVFWGASTCFVSFLGYDVMASSTNLLIHRTRILPVAFSITFWIGLLASFACASSITLLVPSALLEFSGSPFLQAFDIRGVHGMVYLITLGATAGLTASVLACLFALTRILQSLARDGLLFAWLCKGETLPALFTGGLGVALIALFADASALLAILGLGTLINFASVSVSLLCLRYGVTELLPFEFSEMSRDSTATLTSYAEGGMYENAEYPPSPNASKSIPSPPVIRNYGSTMLSSRDMSVDYVNEAFVSSLIKTYEPKSHSSTANLLTLLVTLMAVTGLVTVQLPRFVPLSRRWILGLVICALFLALLICLALLSRHPQHGYHSIKNAVPCVPFLPVCALWMDVHLVVCLPYSAWVAGLVWTLLGLLVYLGYSIRHSTERTTQARREFDLPDIPDSREDNTDQEMLHVENSH